MTSDYVKRCSWNCTWKSKRDSPYTQRRMAKTLIRDQTDHQGCKAATPPVNMGGRCKMFSYHIHVHVQPQEVTLFGISIIASVSKLKWGHSGWGWALNSMTYILTRRGKLKYRDTGDIWEEAMWGWRQRMEVCCHESKIASNQQKLRGKQGRSLPWSPQRELGQDNILIAYYLTSAVLDARALMLFESNTCSILFWQS